MQSRESETCPCHDVPWGSSGNSRTCRVKMKERGARYRRKKGIPEFGSPEHIARCKETGRLANLGRRREETSQWKGLDANSSTIHAHLRINYPKIGICEECGKKGKTEYAFKFHPKPHTREREDYRELCTSCHLSFDEPVIQRAAKMRANGNASS